MANIVTPEEAKEYAEQAILKYKPDYDLTRTSPLYDLLVNCFNQTTLKEILGLYADMIENNSILNTSVSEDEYDKLLANMNFPRNQGNGTSVKVKIVFSSPEDININSSDIFLANDVNFRSKFNLIVPASNYIQESANVFSIEIELISLAIGAVTNLGQDVFFDKTPFDNMDNFQSCYVVNIIQRGQDKETNIEVLDRLQNEYGLESLLFIRGINYVLNKRFPGMIQKTFVAGMSDPEQRRDIVTTQVPIKKARLYFKEKQAVSIPINTELYYNGNVNIKYIFDADSNIFVPIDSNMWKQYYSGDWYIDLPIDMKSLYNPESFQEDMTIECPYLKNAYTENFILSITNMYNKEEGTVKVGAHTDIYCKTSVTRKQVQLFIPIDSDGFIEIPKTYHPVLKIHNIKEVGINNTLKDVEVWQTIVTDPNLRFSARDTMQLFVKPSLVGINILVDLTYAPNIQDIQDFCDDRRIRIIAEDTLIKFFVPVFIGVFGIFPGAGNYESLIKTAITTAIDGNNSNKLIQSLLTSAIGSQIPGFNSAYTNLISLFAHYCLPDGRILDNTNGNDINLPNFVDLGVSERNSTFITEAIQLRYE